jgi:hypothetical protein
MIRIKICTFRKRKAVIKKIKIKDKERERERKKKFNKITLKQRRIKRRIERNKVREERGTDKNNGSSIT